MVLGCVSCLLLCGVACVGLNCGVMLCYVIISYELCGRVVVTCHMLFELLWLVLCCVYRPSAFVCSVCVVLCCYLVWFVL